MNKHSIFILFSCLFFSNVFAQSYTAHTFREIDGIPSNNVFAINQFEDGKLLVVTKNGLCTYDGSNWEKFDYNLPLPSSLNTRIKKLENGNLWLAGFKNQKLKIGFFENKTWKEHSIPQLQDEGVFQYILSFDHKVENDTNYSLIFAIKNELYSYSSLKKAWEEIDLPIQEKSYAINDVKYYGRDIYVLTNNGLWKISDNQQIELVKGDFPNKHFVKMEIDHDNDKFYLLGSNWVGESKKESFTTIVSNFESVFSHHISSSHLYLSESGRLFFGLNSMIYFLKNNGKDFEAINVLGQMEAFWHNCIFVDREENIWLSSNRGLGFISNLSLRFINHSHGLIEDEVSGVLEISEDKLLIGGNYSLVLKSKNDCKVLFKKAQNEQVIYRFSNFLKLKSEVYFSGYQIGIGKLTEDDELIWLAGLPMENRPINGLFVNNDSLFVISDNSIFHWDGSRYTNIINSHSFIRKATYSSNGELWLLTTNGIHVSYNGKVIREYRGLNSNLSNVTDIQAYKDKIYVATYDGLAQIENDTIIPVVNEHMAIERPIFELYRHSDGNLWAGTDYGVFVIENDRIAQHLTHSNGLIGNEVNRNTIIGTEDDEVLIGTVEGLAIFRNSEIHKANYKPLPSIFSMRSTKKKELDLKNKNLLEANENGMEIEFGGITFTSSDFLEFRHRLNGYESEWNEISAKKKTSINYVNLPGGDYVFELQVKDGQGNWSQSTLSSNIQILNPFYKQLWFVGLIGAIAVLLFYFIYQFVIQKKLIKQKELLEIQHDTITKSIRYAKRIQESILPSKNIIDDLFKENFIINQPKDIVSGDFYWFSQRGEKIFFAVADCTGHGVPGSMVSVVCSNALNYVVNELGYLSTAAILDKVRQIVTETFHNEAFDITDGMDIAFCIMDKNSKFLQFSGAHHSLYRVTERSENSEMNSIELDNKMLIEYKGDNQPVGQFNHTNPFTEKHIQLNEGDYLYLSTDGFYDQFGGANGKKMLKAVFMKHLLDLADLDMDNQRKSLLSVFENWKAEEVQIDDVCVVGLKI